MNLKQTILSAIFALLVISCTGINPVEGGKERGSSGVDYTLEPQRYIVKPGKEAWSFAIHPNRNTMLFSNNTQYDNHRYGWVAVYNLSLGKRWVWSKWLRNYTSWDDNGELVYHYKIDESKLVNKHIYSVEVYGFDRNRRGKFYTNSNFQFTYSKPITTERKGGKIRYPVDCPKFDRLCY